MTLRAISGGNTSLRGIGLADYIWLDGLGNIHVKKKSIYVMEERVGGVTNVVPIIEPLAATVFVGNNEHERLILNPCHYLRDPLRDENSFVVLCEARTLENKNHPTNTRAILRAVAEATRDPHGTWWGFKQGYQFKRADGEPLRGEHYLAAERHLCALMDAGVMLYSAQTDAPSGKWNFKIGPRKFPDAVDPQPPSAALVPDFLIFGRYFLEKIARENGFGVEFTSCSVFYSTDKLRTPINREMDAQTLADVVEAKLNFPEQAHARHAWTPDSRPGISGFDVVRGVEDSRTFVEDRGLDASADPYITIARILDALGSGQE